MMYNNYMTLQQKTKNLPPPWIARKACKESVDTVNTASKIQPPSEEDSKHKS